MTLFADSIDQTGHWSWYCPLPSIAMELLAKCWCVDVTTRGKYYPDTALATERDPPLYLHITATTYPALEKASRMVQELIDRDMGSLVDERRFRRTDERDEFGRRKWPEERVPIGMESVRGFNVRAQIVGPGVCSPPSFRSLTDVGILCETYFQ